MNPRTLSDSGIFLNFWYVICSGFRYLVYLHKGGVALCLKEMAKKLAGHHDK